jgi:hypothetical protein
MKVLTVKEAVARVNRGENLEGILLEETTRQQVNVRDAMVLSSGGIVIPEENIYYDDADIEYDEDIDELTITSGPVQLTWEEKAKRAATHSSEFDQEADEGIAHDEAFEGDWVPLETDGLAEAEADLLELSLQVDPAIKAWLAEQSVPAEQLVKQLLEDFYRARKLLDQ